MPHAGTEPGSVRLIGREPVRRPCPLRQQEGAGKRLPRFAKRYIGQRRSAAPPGSVRPIGREPVRRPCTLRQQEGIGKSLTPTRQRAHRAALLRRTVRKCAGLPVHISPLQAK